MILGQVSYLDCVAFLIFLTPRLLIDAGPWETITVALHALPYILLRLPYEFIKERYFTDEDKRTPFVRRASGFQDFVIRCVRYAFANIPATIGKVFFSKQVSLPFFYFRLLRHGFFRSPIHWQEVTTDKMKGIWIIMDPEEDPDVVVYYCHGGGFSMGSSYFYLEFLMAWITLLQRTGYKNPALFALEYTLVPEAVYPKQLEEAMAGYEYVLSKASDPSRICVGGDSAGATLILSLLLRIADLPKLRDQMPGLAVMISPWVTIVSEANRNTKSDYLASQSLELYGKQYIGQKVSPSDPIVSPGNCRDKEWWKRASPHKGWFFLFGSEEVLGPETRRLIALLGDVEVPIDVHEEKGSIHAWPVAALFLDDSPQSRTKGLKEISQAMRRLMH